MNPDPSKVNQDIADRYLDLLESALLDTLYGSRVSTEQHWDAARAGQAASDAEVDEGQYWPERAHTMIGRQRLRNLRQLVTEVVTQEVAGDLIETGVWRGGASIFMKGVLTALGDNNRRIFLADSFAGLPPADPRYPADMGDAHSEVDFLRVSREQVEDNFDRYQLKDERVIFIEGFFEDTLPTAPIEQLALLRLDGDMYSSTIQALESLYDKVSPGGYVVIDDYGLPGCKSAIHDFRSARGIEDPIHQVDWTGAYWQVSR